MKFNTKPLIIIDAGHGKETAGKRSPLWADGSQLLEYAYNRSIARAVQQRLKDAGFDARLLVTDDHDLPLQVRCRRANEWTLDHKQHGGIEAERLLVSIHVNAYEQSSPTPSMVFTPPPGSPVWRGRATLKGVESTSPHVSIQRDSKSFPLGEDLGEASSPSLGGGWGEASGWEAYVCGSNANTRELALELYRQAAEQLPDTFPIRTATGDHRKGHPLRPKTANFYILRYSNCPAVLTENLFMTNATDCAFLLSADGREVITDIHVQAVTNYLKNRM